MFSEMSIYFSRQESIGKIRRNQKNFEKSLNHPPGKRVFLDEYHQENTGFSAFFMVEIL